VSTFLFFTNHGVLPGFTLFLSMKPTSYCCNDERAIFDILNPTKYQDGVVWNIDHTRVHVLLDIVPFKGRPSLKKAHSA
jgi:hypothetical protein